MKVVYGGSDTRNEYMTPFLDAPEARNFIVVHNL